MSVNFCHGSIRHTSKVYSGDADGMFLFWSQSHVQCNFCIVHKYQPITIYFCVGNDSASAISMRTIHLYYQLHTYIPYELIYQSIQLLLRDNIAEIKQVILRFWADGPCHVMKLMASSSLMIYPMELVCIVYCFNSRLLFNKREGISLIDCIRDH